MPFCKLCGKEFPDIRSLTSCSCSNNKGGKHVPYEGNPKTQYVCKYCGKRFPSIRAMTSIRCAGRNDLGQHEPML